MRLRTLTGALALALLLPPGAAGFVADHAPEVPVAAPERVHPVDAPVGYGETAARFGGPRAGRSHAGQDVFAPAGTPLLAVSDSVVVETGSGDGRGHYAALFDPDVRRTYVYFHMLRPAEVRTGERVRAGERIGLLGCTGSCWGDHLHFEIRRGRGGTGAALDPLPFLLRWPRAAT